MYVQEPTQAIEGSKLPFRHPVRISGCHALRIIERRGGGQLSAFGINRPMTNWKMNFKKSQRISYACKVKLTCDNEPGI